MYLVAYDITDKKRLKRVSKLLLRYGRRVQKSVFACDINEHRHRELEGKLMQEKQDGDSIVIWEYKAEFVTEIKPNQNTPCPYRKPEKMKKRLDPREKHRKNASGPAYVKCEAEKNNPGSHSNRETERKPSNRNQTMEPKQQNPSNGNQETETRTERNHPMPEPTAERHKAEYMIIRHVRNQKPGNKKKEKGTSGK